MEQFNGEIGGDSPGGGVILMMKEAFRINNEYREL